MKNKRYNKKALLTIIAIKLSVPNILIVATQDNSNNNPTKLLKTIIPKIFVSFVLTCSLQKNNIFKITEYVNENIIAIIPTVNFIQLTYPTIYYNTYANKKKENNYFIFLFTIPFSG